MHWANKYVLLKRSCRPIPGTYLINNAMSQLVYLGGIMFVVGIIFSINLVDSETSIKAIIPIIIALGISIIFFMMPI
jgi:hypothetical protein